MKSLALGFLLSFFIITGQATAMPLDGSLPDGHGNVLQVRKKILNCSSVCFDQFNRCTKAAAALCSRQMCTEDDFRRQAEAMDQCYSTYQSCMPGCTKDAVKPKL